LKITAPVTSSRSGVNYAIALDHGRVKGKRVTATNNGGVGIRGYRRVLLKEATVTGNGGGGAVAGSNLTVRRSTLTGNGPGGDVAAWYRLKLTDTTCDHSVNISSGGTFGVCALD
jgi:hypothetical protein